MRKQSVPFRPVSLFLVRRFVVENRFPSSVSFWPHIQRSRFDHTPICHMNVTIIWFLLLCRLVLKQVGYLQKSMQETSEAEAKAAAARKDPDVLIHAHHSIVPSSCLPPLPPVELDASAGNVRQARTHAGTSVGGGVI